ncbi:acyl-CoA-binding domain-containing protein 3-like isoform X2 [Lotus japonicus]|uniref:acyl-CoA-binding domain-containing protein 3-like isoform X2 n=1 Tax=Lotus japonicus TaxID=34305 RepID=UPI00258D92DD|nr:acyl-CoA-binding domain-containing protein 3-like isoform X2 [Lotus japonicus]
MELVSASDLFVTASIAILLSLLVAKLVSLATTTDTQTATIHHYHEEEPAGPVLQEDRLTVQTESKVGFINPVQVATNVEKTGHELVEEDTDLTVESGSDSAVGLTAEVVEEEAAERVGEIVEEEASAETAVPVVEGGEGSGEDWEWEGVERSELEELFMAATGFVARNGCGGGGGGGDDGGSDVQMELYGLHKVATEGPCRESQPMPLMLSARAKWNAWQKLGNMSPEVAMERYISLLSDKFPGWMKDSSAGTGEHEPMESESSESAAPSTSLPHQQMMVTDRELELESGAQDHSPLTESDLENKVKK